VIKYILTAVLTVSFAATAFADGGATYADKCADCHGDKGQGMGSKLKNPIAGSKADVTKKAVLEGKGKMKKIALSAGDADEVAKFVEGLKK
jgi:mono/diheme cytochrome c family protein